jgi:hypothetical protein
MAKAIEALILCGGDAMLARIGVMKAGALKLNAALASNTSLFDAAFAAVCCLWLQN